MGSAVTTKGQITIPKRVRDYLGLVPGTRVTFDVAADGSVVLHRDDHQRPPDRFEKLRGVAGPGLSTDELMALLRGED